MKKKIIGILICTLFIVVAVLPAVPGTVNNVGNALKEEQNATEKTGPTAVVFDPPDPAHFFENTDFAIIGDVGFVPAYDADRLWSFSLNTGEPLDPDGLALPNHKSYVAVYPDSRLVVGPYPLIVVDASDPTNLRQIGVLDGISGENVAVDPNGVNGYVATYWGSIPGKLFSFNVETVSVEDELVLPGDPGQIALAGNRLAIADETHGAIMVADVSDPGNLALVGSITCPQPTTFKSPHNIVFADDGRTGFISSEERVLYSFDVIDMTLLDPDGVPFGVSGPQSWGTHIAIYEDTVACVWTEGGLAFVDVSDPSNMAVVRNADFGESVLIQGSATSAFTADGSKVAIATILPDNYVYTFEVSTGNQVSPPFPVEDKPNQPNYLTVYGPSNHVGVVCPSAADSSNIWLIEGLFNPPDPNNSPEAPTITGPTSGAAGTEYVYTFSTTDSDGDDVSYYIKWGDGDITEWTAFQDSGTPYFESHTWDEENTYTIEAKAKDIHGAESDWTTLSVSMPKNKESTDSNDNSNLVGDLGTLSTFGRMR